MAENDILSPRCQRLTKRNFKKKHGNNKDTPVENNTQKTVPDTSILPLDLSHPRKYRVKYFGELIQMDASDHLWFGNAKTFLNLAIDNATRDLVGGYFDHEETLNGYYHVFHQILSQYGIPFKFLTDKRTIFTYKDSKTQSEGKDTFTQFSYACK